MNIFSGEKWFVLRKKQDKTLVVLPKVDNFVMTQTNIAKSIMSRISKHIGGTAKGHG